MPQRMPDRRTCGTMQVHRRHLRTHPLYRENRLKIDYFAAAQAQRTEEAPATPRILTIPVVVHVVYTTGDQNIADSQIRSQLAALNRDYRMTNADVSHVARPFRRFVSDTRIQFRLAKVDPRGRATTGITRTKTSVASFRQDDAVKFKAQGGHDAWPWDRYLNLWVCRLAGVLLGYAQFPGGPGPTDGVVITYKAFGTNGTATPPFDKGRSATHEIGHWLNLHHIWGDDDGDCSNSDGVADTPNQASENYGCPKFPHVTCNNGPNGDMFMNYMDYTNDACMFMFTAGQAARMQVTLGAPRAGIAAQARSVLSAR